LGNQALQAFTGTAGRTTSAAKDAKDAEGDNHLNAIAVLRDPDVPDGECRCLP
jgi:hypothetical protein